MSEKLAFFGGEPTITKKFQSYNSIGEEEIQAATDVVKSGVLSKFYGCWDDAFFGGPKVQKFEKNWADFFNVKHAVSTNSATSCLIAAAGAIGLEPGDEVIVSPWTMCATATAALVWNAIPVFADIETETFNLDPASIEKNITPFTRAIFVTNIFGHPARMNEIMSIAKKHGLKVVEDAAQSPGALYRDKYAGTLADIGVYSLNYHKHIHTGEGGVCVTNNSELGERLQLIRNHAEAVVGDKGVRNLTNMIGFNFRLGEIEAAIGIEQLKKLEKLSEAKTRAGIRLSEGLKRLKGLQTPQVHDGCTHVYYIYGITLDTEALKASRYQIHKALIAEGVPSLEQGYQNIHLLPMYQKKMAHGSKGFPWTSPHYRGNVSYDKGICPMAEKLHDQTMMGIETCTLQFNDLEIDSTVQAFQKVWRNLPQVRDIPEKQ